MTRPARTPTTTRPTSTSPPRPRRTRRPTRRRHRLGHGDEPGHPERDGRHRDRAADAERLRAAPRRTPGRRPGCPPAWPSPPTASISGTPTAAGTSSVTVTATDSAGATGSATFSFQVARAAPTIVPIAAIQGTNTDTSPYAGQTVTTEGVVTAAYPTGGFNGFFLETGGAGGTEAADADPGRLRRGLRLRLDLGRPGHASARASRSPARCTEFQGETEIGSPTVTQLATALPAVVPDQIPWSDLATDAAEGGARGRADRAAGRLHRVGQLRRELLRLVHAGRGRHAAAPADRRRHRRQRRRRRPPRPTTPPGW